MKKQMEQSMKFRKLRCVAGITLFAALAMPVRLAAQEQHRYKLIDLGTLGGPSSYNEFLFGGRVIGGADLPIPDPYAPNCIQNCFVSHAFEWQKGALTDLGALPGVNSSGANATNSPGQTVGYSENGVIDPLTGFPEIRAVLWQLGKVIDLGTFGGNNALALSINNRGQVVGGALNATPDPFGFCSQPFTPFYSTQVHAFRWENGLMQDLGTLGGLDSCAFFVNERGQVAGISYTNTTPNPGTGAPTQDPFLWLNGKMTDLGSLGGTFGFPNALNNRGQVVGRSNLAGDSIRHPFLWDKGVLTDLGNFGGTFGEAIQINAAGEVIGGATTTGDQAVDAFLWTDGVMTDLGTLPGDLCSFPTDINSRGQIVGTSNVCQAVEHAVLWQHGHIIDLQAFVPPGSVLSLQSARSINDRGEIVVNGLLPNGDFHAVLLIPCGGDNADGKDCQHGDESGAASTHTVMAPGNLTPETLAAIRARLGRQLPYPGLGRVPAPPK